MTSIRDAGEIDIPLIRLLAEKTWWPTYSPILEKEQLDYMLQMIYNEDSLRKAMSETQKFLIVEEDNTALGFASYGQWEEDPETWKIFKLYVLPEAHGRGLGARLVTEIKERALQSGMSALVLNVNRHNPAFTFYRKLDFHVLREEDIAIGPYWMNDYVMRMELRHPTVK